MIGDDLNAVKVGTMVIINNHVLKIASVLAQSMY